MLRRLWRRGVLDALERLTGLTGPGLLTLLAAVVTVVAGHLLGSAGLSLFGYAVGLVLLVVWVQSRRRVAVDAVRGSLPSRVTRGRRIDVDLALTPRRRLTSVVVEERFPEALWPTVRLGLPVLPAGEATTARYEFRAEQRGRFQVGPLLLERTDPFGLVRSRQELAPAVELVVHPATEPVVDRILSRAFEDPVLRPPHSRPWPTGAEFYGMRPYHYGDDPRRIVWRASARRGELLVREAEHGITDTVCVVLDTALASYPLPHELSPVFEKAVSVAASVGVHHLANGFSVQLEGGSGPLTGRLRGKEDRFELLDALAGVGRGDDTLELTAFRLLRQRVGAGHHVVVTHDLTPASTAALRAFVDQGRAMTLVLVVDETTDVTLFQHASELRCPVIEVNPADALSRPFQQALAVRPR